MKLSDPLKQKMLMQLESGLVDDSALTLDHLEALGSLPAPWPAEALRIAIKRLRQIDADRENERLEGLANAD